MHTNLIFKNTWTNKQKPWLELTGQRKSHRGHQTERKAGVKSLNGKLMVILIYFQASSVCMSREQNMKHEMMK